MRNLKKILAMVLALVMSLSLMATAGAANFTDADSINDTFQPAVEVLEGLGVFRGYDENGSYSFKPTGEITRAETAAIIYRIVTGDVKDEQVGIYADYNLFSDVPSTSWYAGYVNFCANAEYIKGVGNGKFDPSSRVTGYAALAMILRAIGYTANGGFTGSDWAVQTARTGEARKITKNIMTGTLGQPATRESVAEILYQAIMVNMVDHNVLNTLNGQQGYTEKNITLGQQTFGLENVSGVIMANEWANLDDDTVLAAGNTKILVTKTNQDDPAVKEGDSITVEAVVSEDMQEALDAVGLTYDLHIANPDGKGVRALTMDKNAVNVVAYNEGKGVYKASEHDNLNNSTWNTIEDLAKTESIKLGTGAETEYFVNYEERWDANCTSEYRISYAIAEESLTGHDTLTNVKDNGWKAYIDELDTLTNHGAIPAPSTSKYAGHYLGERTIKIDLDLDGTAETDVKCWVVAIAPENTINQTDLEIMKEIFYTADRIGNNGTLAELLQNYAIGEVYVGTTSMQDYSDTMSWNEFCAKYFVDDVNSRKFETCEIGNSLRIIDNDGDGVAEYVLRIDYAQDKIVGTYKSQPAGNKVLVGNYEGNLLYNPQADEIDQGTIVNFTEIDKKLYVWPAPVVTGKITNKNFQNITVTADNGETYNQSGIDNYTQLDENIMLMNNNTEYNMYMDVYGNNIRSYELAQGSKYALLTEMYPTTNYNGNYVYNYGAIAEVKIADADVTEYPVTINNSTGLNTFFSPSIWTWGLRGYFGVNAGTTIGSAIPSAQILNANYLQPAVAHLGIASIYANNNTTLVSGLGRSGNNTLAAVKPGQTTNTENPDTAISPDYDWYRAVADVKAYSGVTNLVNGTGGLYGMFDYDQARVGGDSNINLSTDDEVNTGATFSYTNVASYVDVDGTLTLTTASKLSKNNTNGSQIYRVGEKAANAAVALYKHGTEAELVKAFNDYLTNNSLANLTVDGTPFTTGQDWFNHFVGESYRQGNGIYPVYSEDYVQLDLTKTDMGVALDGDDLVVKPGIRHFHIDDNYDKLYNTNSNNYVDATVDTEFYIVLPGTAKSIIYKVGYADLPNIKVEDIRAAYAVAHNTRDDSDGQDYWVADVIVIETSKETLNYDSISLVYYNPYEQNGYIRYADTLNNEWLNLQPDYENKAMMGITPAGGFNDNSWGDYSWSTTAESNYDFWMLYRTELTAPGQLSVGTVSRITGDWNDYGIYAGVATRIEDLQRSEYIDVSVRKTGCVQSYAIDVDYAEATEVPFYRISANTNAAYGTIYTATQLNKNRTLNLSDVKDGDELIWVYNKAQNRIAYVIDLGDRSAAEMGNSTGYTAPAWLKTLYADIYAYENPAPGATSYTVTAEFYTDITDAATKVADAGIAVTPAAIAAADVNKLNELKWTETGAYTIDTGVAPQITNAQMVNDATKTYITAVTGNVVIKFEVNQDADYHVELVDGTDPVNAGIAAGYAATALTNKAGGASITKSGDDVAYGTVVVATVTRTNATTGYTATKTVGGVTTDLVPVSANGTTVVYEVEVTADTVITVAEDAAAVGDTADITELAFSVGDDDDSIADGDTVTVANIPAGTTSTIMTPTVTGAGATLKVWRGLPAANQAVTANTDGTYTLSVGAASAPITYTVEAYAQNGAKTETVTVVLAAVAPSANINLKASAAGAGLVTGVTHVAAQDGPPAVLADYTITIAAAMQGSTTVGQLLSWLTSDGDAVGSIVVVENGTATTALPADTEVVNTMKVLVTAADGTTTQYYDITFA